MPLDDYGLGGRWVTWGTAGQIEEMIEEGATIHARLGSDERMLCEYDGPDLAKTGDDLIALVLDHPETRPEWKATVNCQGCLEWMRA